MNGDVENILDLLEDTAVFLEWQKRLGHNGLPIQMLLEHRKQKQVEEKPKFQHNTLPSENEMARKPAVPKADKMSKPVLPTFSAADEKITLEAIKNEIGDCKRCKLCKTRNSIVFGEGDPNADIMFIGEGPGKDEDEQGRPFVGRAGKLLDRWIELGMGLKREDVYIGNIVKCRPPGNRNPETDESEACIGFIKQQIKAVKPKVLVLLGNVPTGRMLGEKTGITKVHGTWYSYEGIPTMPIFHPSYCLRPPQDEKRKIIWADIKKILKFLDMPIPGKK